MIVLRTAIHWYRAGGLLNSLAILTVSNGFQGFAILAIDSEYIGRRIVAKLLVDAGLIEMGREAYLKLYEPNEPELEMWYPYVNNQFFLCAMLAPVFPLATLIGALWLFIYYWAAKVRLLRVCKSPSFEITAQLDKEMQDLLQWIVLAVPFVTLCNGIHQLTKQETFVAMLVCICLGLVYIAVPSTGIINTIYKWRGKQDEHTIGVTVRSLLPEDDVVQRFVSNHHAFEDYYDTQFHWPKHQKYHKSYFLLAALPEEVNPENIPRPSPLRQSEEPELVDLLENHLEHVKTSKVQAIEELVKDD